MKNLLYRARTSPVPLVLFVAFLCVFNLMAFQGPLLEYALTVSDFSKSHGYVQIASLQIVQVTLLAASLFLFATISVLAMRVLAILLNSCNAAALYFMTMFSIDIDRSMIANFFNTDFREASELWHPSSLLFLLGLGLLPATFICLLRVSAPKRLWRMAYAICATGILTLWLAVTSYTFLWYDQHATQMGSKVLPWSYIVNTARHFNSVAMNGRKQILLPNATFIHDSPVQKEIVILVIGEALRADHLNLLGYNRDTNPFTKNLGIIAFPIGESCATNTIGSTACILTHEGRTASSRTNFETLPSYLTRHGVETIFRSNNSGPPPVNVDTYRTAENLFNACSGQTCPDKVRDGALNLGLRELLEGTVSNRVFVTIHQSGSHGPAYYSKYPDDFEFFTPVCKTVQIANCSQQELINAYDNTIRYTDSLLADLISQLDKIPNSNSVLIFVADHGQSLGEGGYYLHGAPMAFAPPEQTRVPFLVWMSDGFKSERGLSSSAILRSETYPHDFPFHSVMGAFGLTSKIYKPEFDIFNPTGGAK